MSELIGQTDLVQEVPEQIPTPVGPEDGALTARSMTAARIRGECGGVKMALAGTRQALEIADGRFPVYTNRKIVNNDPVMGELTRSGLRDFGNDWTTVPDGSVVLFSAHGIPPYYHDIAQEKGLITIDLTCQLVDRVHRLATEAERAGKHVLYAGVEHHPETVGVMEEINPDNFTLIRNLEDAKGVKLPDDKIAILLSQTTLSTAELREIFDFFSDNPQVQIPKRWDICPATDKNQKSVRELIEEYGVDFLLVQGSKDSHNSKELARMGWNAGIPAEMIDSVDDLRRGWFTGGITSVGFTAGASVEDRFTEPVFEWFRREGIEPVDLMLGEKREKQFTLPEADIRRLQEYKAS